MSIWSRIGEALSALSSGATLSEVFDKLRTPPEQTVGFAIAVIALGAKIAKADGQVTRDEISAFREVFHIPPGEEANTARVYNMARQDVAGFEAYASRIAAMYGTGHAALSDLMEGLFHIALADGDYHPAEDDYLSRVAEIFGLSVSDFRRLRARFVTGAVQDPYAVLGVAPDLALEDIKAAWRQLVRDSHPDRMIARGVPEEAVKMAEKRLIAVNQAWEEIQTLRG